MINRYAKISAAAVLTLAVVGVSAAAAEVKGERAVDQYTCKDIMRESGSSCDVAIGFIHGYLLGRVGATTFSIDALHKQTDAFIERCLDNPGEKALEAMTKAKG